MTGWTARERYLYFQEALGNEWPAAMVKTEPWDSVVSEARLDVVLAIAQGEYDEPLVLSVPQTLSITGINRRWQ